MFLCMCSKTLLSGISIQFCLYGSACIAEQECPVHWLLTALPGINLKMEVQ